MDTVFDFSGIIKWILEWPPLYILGRLTYTAYFVHIPLLLLRARIIRSPVYFNEYSIISTCTSLKDTSNSCTYF